MGEIRWAVTEIILSQCILHLEASQRLFLQARLRLNGDLTCWERMVHSSDYKIVMTYDTKEPSLELASMYCKHSPHYQAIFSSNNHLYFFMREAVDITIKFGSSQRFLKNTLPVLMISETSGYITSPGYDGLCFSPPQVNATHTVIVPRGYEAVMVSFEQLMLEILYKEKSCYGSYLALSYTEMNVTRQARLCHQPQRLTKVLQVDSLSIRLHVGDVVHETKGFKMLFSFHKKSALPMQNDDGLFNCSVKHYPSFQQHLDCNMQIECEDGRDETERCPFSSKACQGKLASGSKCFFVVFRADRGNSNTPTELDSTETTPFISTQSRPLHSFSLQCQKQGGTLAVSQTREEQDDVYKMLSFGKIGNRCGKFLTGLVYGGQSMPNMYRQMWTGKDRSVVYRFIFYTILKGYPDNTVYSTAEELCQTFQTPIQFGVVMPCDPEACGAVCQTHFSPPTHGVNLSLIKPPEANIQEHRLSFNITNAYVSPKKERPSQPPLVLTVCPKGHLTHLFLMCDTNNDCGLTRCVQGCNVSFKPTAQSSDTSITRGEFDLKKSSHQKTIRTVSVTNSWETLTRSHHDQVYIYMFFCDNGVQTVHYTNVCDFRADCRDLSDELFCKHRPCGQFTCSSGQCVSYSNVCDGLADCWDNSDEQVCNREFQSHFDYESAMPTPSIINFDGRGHFSHAVLNATDHCPYTHYRCPGQLDCLPVYTRCNGYYDCLGREDENDCENQSCPGYYRCRGSPVCVHLDHLCDGWPQCPEGDDELLCEENPCPDGCLCHGLAFVCVQPFDTQQFPDLRYFQGTGSGLTPADFYSNHYMVYLSLQRCGLQFVDPTTSLQNLRHLDLSHNKLCNVSTGVFLPLENLKFVSLAHNPLHTLHSEWSTLKQINLRHFDLAFTDLYSFSGKPLSRFLSLQRLNLSHAGVRILQNGGFQNLPSLTELELSGCLVEQFPSDLFHDLTRLQTITADTYKLCCKTILPANFDHNFCFAPQDEISSCEDLLRSGTYRGFLWLMSVLSISGNVFCFVFRFLVAKKNTKSSFNMFVSSLLMADFIMGVYVSIIGMADLSFRGVYLHNDVVWTHSVACRVAGFLSLLSKEVSAITILVITLDRFVVLRFPLSSLRFGRRSTIVTVTSVWIVGFILAVIPLLPVTSHWQFYSQTGICIPLPITRFDFEGRSYSFGVVIIFNFVLFVLITVGQVVIYWSVRQNAKDSHTTNKKCKHMIVARRLIIVAVTDFLCWFPIGVCGLLALAGIPIPGEINVAMAIFVLPLNSAINPFIYTFNIVLEKRRRVAQQRLLKLLESTVI